MYTCSLFGCLFHFLLRNLTIHEFQLFGHNSKTRYFHPFEVSHH
uniref:Uncharacterized protein n=1 Tax=Rhizophora mucronata TaxID=61149 RepID=A0A2P2Q944_RHIMU